MIKVITKINLRHIQATIAWHRHKGNHVPLASQNINPTMFKIKIHHDSWLKLNRTHLNFTVYFWESRQSNDKFQRAGQAPPWLARIHFHFTQKFVYLFSKFWNVTLADAFMLHPGSRRPPTASNQPPSGFQWKSKYYY